LSDFAAKLLEEAQKDFPVDERPYLRLAERLGATEAQVLDTFVELLASGLIRELSAFLDPRKLGYQSTLACMSVPEGRIDEVAGVLAEMPEVTHNYLRDHHYNMWFAVIAPSRAGIEAVLGTIEERTGCGPVHDLPARKFFKLQVMFPAEGMSL
jgi:DNA-binding Lrp family transcriptional regulator